MYQDRNIGCFIERSLSYGEDKFRRVQGTGVKKCLRDIGDKCQEEVLLPDFKVELWKEFLSGQGKPRRPQPLVGSWSPKAQRFL